MFRLRYHEVRLGRAYDSKPQRGSAMLAARWFGQRDIRIEDIAAPMPPPPGWVCLRVERCGICATDVHEYVSGPHLVPTEPHVLTGRHAPLTLGHEVAGVVHEVGSDVSFDLGTRVAVEGNRHCGACYWCKRAETHLCVALAQLGLQDDGGLAEYMLAPAALCAPVCNTVSASHAALAEPLSVAVHALNRSAVSLDSKVCVVGAGTIGLLIVQLARLVGASLIVVAEPLTARRNLALKLGADFCMSLKDVTAAALDLTQGIGFDSAIEAAGQADASVGAVTLVRKGGTAVFVGGYDGNLVVPMESLIAGEKRIHTSLSHNFTTDFGTAISLIGQHRLNLDAIVTCVISLKNVLCDGFERLASNNHDGRYIKILVSPEQH